MIDILEDPVPAIKRRKQIRDLIEWSNLIHIWVANGQSLNT